MANQTAGLAGRGAARAANLWVSGEPFALPPPALDAWSALSSTSSSIARALSVSLAGPAGAASTTRGGDAENSGATRPILAPQRLHGRATRRPPTFPAP